MTDLPYTDLFPIIHPLERPAQRVFEQIPEMFKPDLKNNYEFHLPQGYMTAEKLNKAINQLKKLKVFGTHNIDILIKKYDISDFTKKNTINLDDKKQCAAFWVLNAAAFWFLNRFLETKDEKISEHASYCFRMAHDYKFAWNERIGRRNGGNTRAQNINRTKELLYDIWVNYSEEIKLCVKASVNTLETYMDRHIKDIPYKKIRRSTIMTWCRTWKGKYKQEHRI